MIPAFGSGEGRGRGLEGGEYRAVAYCGLVLVEHLVILGHGHAEDDGRDVLEAVDPLLALRALSAHIEQLEVEVLEGEVHLNDARGLDSRAQNVLFGGHVVLLAQTVKVVQEAEERGVRRDRAGRDSLFGRVVQLVLVGATEALLNAHIHPQALHCGQEIVGEGFGVFHARHHVEDHLGVGLALIVAERDAEVGHGAQNGHHGLNGVRVDDRLVLLEVLSGEARVVDDPARESERAKRALLLTSSASQ